MKENKLMKIAGMCLLVLLAASVVVAEERDFEEIADYRSVRIDESELEFESKVESNEDLDEDSQEDVDIDWLNESIGQIYAKGYYSNTFAVKNNNHALSADVRYNSAKIGGGLAVGFANNNFAFEIEALNSGQIDADKGSIVSKMADADGKKLEEEVFWQYLSIRTPSDAQKSIEKHDEFIKSGQRIKIDARKIIESEGIDTHDINSLNALLSDNLQKNIKKARNNQDLFRDVKIILEDKESSINNQKVKATVEIKSLKYSAGMLNAYYRTQTEIADLYLGAGFGAAMTNINGAANKFAPAAQAKVNLMFKISDKIMPYIGARALYVATTEYLLKANNFSASFKRADYEKLDNLKVFTNIDTKYKELESHMRKECVIECENISGQIKDPSFKPYPGLKPIDGLKTYEKTRLFPEDISIQTSNSFLKNDSDVNIKFKQSYLLYSFEAGLMIPFSV